MAVALQGCHVCGRRFEVKFSFQVQRDAQGSVSYYCTQACMLKARAAQGGVLASRAPMPTRARVPQPTAARPSRNASSSGHVNCKTCSKSFKLLYAFQQVTVGQHTDYFCSMECRSPVIRNLEAKIGRKRRGPKRIAILNQKGGTGKTTTTVNLAAGLAAAGQRTLVVDLDAQGHVGVSLGVKGERSLYHMIVEEMAPEDCVVNVRENLDIITSNETLASAEICLARMNEGRERILSARMAHVQDYDFILMDCGPSLSLLNMNALTYADQIIVPVSCDFLSLVGVKQILRTLKNVNRILLHPISIMGILPTFYDRRNKISNEAVNTLKGYFKDKVLPPIRVNTRLKEAPSHKKTIFEYAPDSHGARDYKRLVDWVINQADSKQNVA